MIIKNITERDIKRSDVWAKAWLPSKESIKQQRRFVHFNFIQEPDLCFLAESDKILGFVLARRISGDMVYIGPMAVLPDSRDHGIGRKLLKKVEEAARKKKYYSALLNTDLKNKKLDKFYSSLGYEVIAKTPKKKLWYKELRS
jgi:ribosomal protein S18 acetylase RimI-like enzyme